jgi:anti-sigma-K factor RskA
MDVTRDDRPELEPPILQGLGQVVPQVDPPSALRARVLESIATKPVVKARTVSPTLWRLATAASLALAGGLSLYTLQLRGRISTLEDELRDTRARADAADQRMASAVSTAAGALNTVAVLTAPDVARVDLAGQAVAPTATARAFWSRSRGMVFTASNLPPLPAGKTYQLWVVTGQGPISAGLLTLDAQGGANETIKTPVDIPQPVAMAVTIEPLGGSPGPTGERYLVGTL